MPSTPLIPRFLCGQKLNHNRTVLRRPALRLAAVAAAVALLGGIAGPARAAGPLPTPPTHPNGTQRMLIPAYFSPGGTGAPVWRNMCERIRSSLAVSLIIMNPPTNGHFTQAEQQYRDGMAACQQRGQSVIGYVDTDYSTISVAAVKTNIDRYFNLYPGIRGIFFDQVLNDPATGQTPAQLVAYYKTLGDYVHQRSPGAKVVLNAGPGAHTNWQMPFTDILVNFENTAAAFELWSPKDWMLSAYPADRFAHLIYATPTASTEATCSRSQANHAGWVFVTSEQLAHLWKAPPSQALLACRSLYNKPVVCCASRTAAPKATLQKRPDARPR